MPDTRHIACLTPSLQIGGAERVMAGLACEFAKDPKLSVDLIVYGRGRESVYELHPAVNLRFPPFDFDLNQRLRSTLRTMWFLRRVLTSKPYDAVLSFGERWNNFARLSALGTQTPIYLSDRSSPTLSLGVLQSTLRKVLYPGAKGLIAQTARAAEVARSQRLNQRIAIIQNPLSIKPALASGQRRNIVLSVGRLIATKNHDRLIRIFAEIGDPDWSLVIVGGDSQKQEHRAKLETLACDLGIAPQVQFAGSRTDVERFYAESKIFAFASSSEGFPNTLAEALASGLPVVAYDCDAGPADLVNHGKNGFLIGLFDDAEFKARLQQLMTDDGLRERMSAAAASSVGHLAPELVAQEMLAFMFGSGS